MDISYPNAFWLLLLGCVFIRRHLVSRDTGRNLPGDWGQLVEAPLQSVMDDGVRQKSSKVVVFQCLLWALLVTALSKPVIGAYDSADYSNLAGRIIALDLGANADIEELRYLTNQLLEQELDVPTALVVATSDAFDAVPLTLDRGFLDRYLNVINADVMPVDGRSLDVMLAHAEAILTRAGVIVGQVVLLTGGEAPTVLAESKATWLRSLVTTAASDGNWKQIASGIEARLTDGSGLGDVARDLVNEIDHTLSNSKQSANVALWPLIIMAASALWLLQFRRRQPA